MDIHSIGIQGLGDVRTTRYAGELLFCISDIALGIGKTTPAKAIANRCCAALRTKIRVGHRVLHFVDVAAAAIEIGASNIASRERAMIAMTGLIHAYTANAGRDGAPSPAPTVQGMPAPRTTAVPGATVREAMKAMGLLHAMDARSTGKFVSERYKGERTADAGGMIYADAAQVARLVTECAKRFKG